MNSKIIDESQKKQTNKKTKRGSIIKDNKKANKLNTKNDFWDIDIDNNKQMYNNYNLTSLENSQNNQNSYFNKIKNRSIEKDKNNTLYDKYKNLLKNEKKGKNINTIKFNNKERIKNKKNNRNNSVDMNKISNMKNRKIKFDDLSVFERNKKWLENKLEKLNYEKQKYINKEEKEYQNILQRCQNNKKINKNIIYNEEDNVAFKMENYNFFMRLIKGRQERERSLDYNAPYGKVNCLKSSHYSVRQPGNISQREMKRYMKYIHNELKQTNNQN